MPTLNIEHTRDRLQAFDFKTLFVEELGWSQPASRRSITLHHDNIGFTFQHVAELSGVVVLEVTAENGSIPPARVRAALHRALSSHYHENVLIFVDAARAQSLWYWVKREGGKLFPREHLFMRGQPGDLFISKLTGIVFDISHFDAEGNIPIVTVAERLKQALDVERVTKKFYREFTEEREEFTGLIRGIANERDRKWYASILLNRLMFIYFLQRKSRVDNGNEDYLQEKLALAHNRFGSDSYYRRLLVPLFFEGFAKPESERSAEVRALLGDIVYLNGGFFLPHRIEVENPDIQVPDVAFENLYRLFGRYSWNLNDTPGGADDEINPDVLGYIFEKYINQKAFGAFYTRPEITEYLCERTIHQLILDRMNPSAEIPGLPAPRHFDSLADLLLDLDAGLCRRLLFDVLPSLAILDPACGSGAFLVAAMKTLINVYSAVTGRIEYLTDRHLLEWLGKTRKEHHSLNYFIKRRIITDNLFGVDIMEEACEIAKLRLFLALVSSVQPADQLEPLPNIDFNILPGNSLIGLLHVDDAEFNARNAQGNLFRKSYREVVEEKNRLTRIYRKTAEYHKDLQAMRDEINKKKKEAAETLDEILLEDFKELGIKFEQATWDDSKGEEGKPTKRPLLLDDIRALHPFHWGYEFDEVLNNRGGFDAIITNPPWEIFKPNSKEFFAEYSGLVTMNTMTIGEFDEHQAELLREPDIRHAWLEYLSRFPHVSAYYRSVSHYANQISMVNGKKAGTDINLYKLFTEQCWNLLRSGGQCGIVLPSGIYTDLGTKQLRELLYGKTTVAGLFGFENRKLVFEGVDSRFKFVVLTYAKAGCTDTIRAAFMRHDVRDLEHFPERGSLAIPVTLIRRLSPDSLSLMEFKTEVDVRIAEKMLRFPLLGDRTSGGWNVSFSAEFHMTNDAKKIPFETTPSADRLPLYEGRMIHHYIHDYALPRYWVPEVRGRKALLGRQADVGQKLDYQTCRLGFRDIARNTDTRTLICTIIPPTFHGNKLPTIKVFGEHSERLIQDTQQLFLCAVWSSFVMDSMLRQKLTTTVNFFYLYQLPVPRLADRDEAFWPIVLRAARLTCTSQEYDNFAREVGLRGYRDGVTNANERGRLRAELNGLVAHMYDLTEEEFAHILSSFPLVPDPVKVAAQNAYRDVARGVVK